MHITLLHLLLAHVKVNSFLCMPERLTVGWVEDGKARIT